MGTHVRTPDSTRSSVRSIDELLVDSPLASPHPVEPINILIVDDEAKNLAVLETVLDDPNYRLVRAESGDQALLALIVEEFAVMILDIQMPGMTGFELARLIKERKKTAGIPIIFLTAYFSEEHDILTGYQTGAVDYLHKPINATILRSKVAVFAELHRKTRENHLSNAALLAEVAERRRVQEKLKELNDELEGRVASRTNELLTVNEALSVSEDRLRRAQQAGKVAPWEWDLTTGVGAWPEQASEIGEAFREQSITIDDWLKQVHSDDREHVIEAFELAKLSGAYRDEFRLSCADAADVRWMESVGAVEYDGTLPRRMRGVIRDITERKLFELQLEDNNRRKDEFLAMLGHELRNPLAPIRNAVSVLQQDEPDRETIGWCSAVIDRQTAHLTRLVDDLLDVSRVSSGRIKLQKEIVQLDLALAQAVEACRPLIHSRGHDLKLHLPHLPVHVRGDVSRLSQIIANLLNNAAKYTNDGGTIVLSIELDHSTVPTAVLRVRDSGRGFDPASARRLFDLFFQVERDLDRSEGGLGIGLSLVRSLVQLHGGNIEAHSPGVGQGSEFIVRLPVCEAAASETHPLRTDSQPSARLQVLIVDDNRDSAQSLGMLLKLLGHSVTLAYDGFQALEIALREQPHVILMDIGLPGMSGYEACRQMRNAGLTSCQIIAVTGYGQESDRREAEGAGFNLHFVKPIGVDQLKSVFHDPSAARRSAAVS